MRGARPSKNHDERRRIVIDMLEFIHDFNQLDTTLLIAKAQEHDFKFVEAAEAVLQSAVGPWNSIEALRNFCVQALGGEKPLRDMDRIRPRARVSPFSVPYDLLCTHFERGRFDPARLSSLGETLEKELPSDNTEIGRKIVPQDQWWLITTVWARPVPRHPPYRWLKLQIIDEGAGRILHDGVLQALYEEPMPCWWSLPPNSSLRVSVHGYTSSDFTSTMLLLAFEGWNYYWSRS